jgi:hypothetical protein
MELRPVEAQARLFEALRLEIRHNHGTHTTVCRATLVARPEGTHLHNQSRFPDAL